MRVNMQRPIKFRGWHPKWKLMTGTPATQSNNFDFTFTAKTNKEPIGEIDSMDDFIIEQYTGLKDKNGVDIYQSDLCAMNSYLTAEVRYKVNMGAWYAGSKRLTKELASQIEVKGNIHES